MCANSDYYTANLNTANQWQPKIIFITAACWMQSLLYRHVLNQILSLPLSSYCVSISGVKPPANDHFLENNHNCTLTRQTRLQHSPETTLQEKKKKLVQYIPSANEHQQQQLQRDLLAWEGRVTSISLGRERMWPRNATLGNSCPSFTPGGFTSWGLKSPGQAPSRDMRTDFHILSYYQGFGPGQQLCGVSFHHARLICKEHFSKRELNTLQQRIIYLP